MPPRKRKSDALDAARERARKKMTEEKNATKPTAAAGIDDDEAEDDTMKHRKKRMKTEEDTGKKKKLAEVKAKAKAWADKEFGGQPKSAPSTDTVGKKSTTPVKKTNTSAKVKSPAPRNIKSSHVSSKKKAPVNIQFANVRVSAVPASNRGSAKSADTDDDYSPTRSPVVDPNNDSTSDEDHNNENTDKAIQFQVVLQVVDNAAKFGREPTNDNPPVGLDGSGDDDEDDDESGVEQFDTSDPIIVDGVYDQVPLLDSSCFCSLRRFVSWSLRLFRHRHHQFVVFVWWSSVLP
jgi:hypothetical protein